MYRSDKIDPVVEQRRTLFRNSKRRTSIAIYGSFSGSRKEDLCSLRDHLRSPAIGYNARISEDLDPDPQGVTKKAPGKNRELSLKLINESDIHIFVMPLRKENESDNIIQSVSMELERLNTLIEYGHKRNQHIIIFLEEGLMDQERWGLGGVCSDLIEINEDVWDIGFYEKIEDTLKPANRFCERCLEYRGGY